jgi:hypothetical protein
MRSRSRLATGAMLVMLGLFLSACSARSQPFSSQTLSGTARGSAFEVDVRSPRSVRADPAGWSELFRATYRNVGGRRVSFGFTFAVASAPSSCVLGPVQSWANLRAAMKGPGWPGEIVNLDPGDSVISALKRPLTAKCRGDIDVVVVAQPLGADHSARVERHVRVAVGA